MSTTVETLEHWDIGCNNIDNGEYANAIKYFTIVIENSVIPSSNMYYNRASVHFILNQLNEAVEDLTIAISKNEHLAIAYFQRGVIYAKMGKLDNANADFKLAEKKLRGNLLIDYKQLGMNYKLTQIEIRINIAYCDNMQGRGRAALTELQELSHINFPSKQKVIETALENFKSGKLSLCYLTKEASCFRPAKSKMDAAHDHKDYMQADKVKKYVVGEDKYSKDLITSDKSSKTTIASSKRPSKPTFEAPTLINKGVQRAPPPPIKKPAPPTIKPARPTQPVLAKHSASEKVLIKVHYNFTILLYIENTITFAKMKELLAAKLNVKKHAVSIWYKPNIDLVCIYDNPTWKHALGSSRVTIWAYDEPVIEGRDCIALYNYDPQEAGDLMFKAGDIILITREINEHWLEGKLNKEGEDGVFPRSYVKIE